MKITISTQILDGNLGDGWTDNYEAAEALAEYTREQWMRDLDDYIARGANVEIDIEVSKNTSGCSRGLEIIVESGSEDDYEQAEIIRGLLTDEGRIWTNFCSSAAAGELIEVAQ